MRERTKNCILLLSLGLVLFGLSLACLFHRPLALSESERRPLAQLPALSLESLVSGDFMADFEDYAPDQFPLREGFRRLKAYVQHYLLGMRDNNGVYRAEGMLSKLEYPLGESSVIRAAKKFVALYERYMAGTDVSAYYAIVPDKNYFLAAQHGYPSMDYGRLVELMEENVEHLRYVDIFPTLELGDYYSTDTHWRQERLEDTLRAIGEAMGFADRLSWEYEMGEYGPFYGVYAGQWALPVEGERIYYLRSPAIEGCRVYNFETGGYTPVYDMEKAQGSDPYDLFLSGAAALLTVENPAASTDKELILFRDSFGSSIAPLFLEAYAKVTLVDIRYISSEYLGELIEFQDQDVLFLYSTLVLNNSMSLK